jgi:galactokinase/mevalonate kinase-like predicted kinase
MTGASAFLVGGGGSGALGGGGGGCLWILGEPDQVIQVKNKISQLESAKILNFSIDYSGVQSQIISV